MTELFDQTAELSLVGAVSAEPKSLMWVLAQPEDFFDPSVVSFFKAVRRLQDAEQDVTADSIRFELQKMDVWQQMLSSGFFKKVLTAPECDTKKAIQENDRIVRECSSRRKLITVLQQATGHLSNMDSGMESELARLKNKIREIQSGTIDGKAATAVAVVDALVQTLDERVNSSTGTQDLYAKTHFGRLDSVINGLRYGYVSVVAARPGMGKTAFGLNLLQNVAVQSQIPSLVISIEMTSEELLVRQLANACNVDHFRLEMGNLNDQEWMVMGRELPKIRSSPIFYDEKTNDIDRITQSIAFHVSEHGVRFVLIDYFQIVSMSRFCQSEVEKLNYISSELRECAKEHKVAILLLSQLNRVSEHKANPRPSLADIKGTGNLEQDAYLVLSLFRPEYYNKRGQDNPPTGNDGLCEVSVLKHRNGKVDSVNMEFYGPYFQFREMY